MYLTIFAGKHMGSRLGPIIILEDDADEQELLTEVFQRLNISNEVKFFSDGERFIEYVRTTRDSPFIIISDVNVPLLNGLEVKSIINSNDFLRKKSIPFVFLSTSGAKSAVEQAYDLNAQGFFLKQNSIDKIEKQIKLILDYWAECKHTNNV